MNTLNTNKAGLTVGLFIGGLHAVWSVLVLSGFAQTLYDFILWAHMIHLPIIIGPFEVTAAITLVIVTFLMGYAFGYAFAYLWNWLHRGA
ncbi:hypothetical protein A3D71_02495 [Candidatus Kaiserbacteria bacterium RIFCSPHIGHO2_02_FULL_55_20]|uniref:DUF2062 domain-containing protein n=1 Tax=Candidatus Kaiserbacteria bacterium RIFCSPHIGHO2_02_FULL_55_20 TaxID=1798497 RepID=A0A1F6DYE9_9BACT|nr:MAG: hypothetical protein A2680_01965 [Candidatus Kaiserbacteria bacterium RIFCSPHIGHO2_01_FULL_55_37]OGG66416.1 MAG: hypothetical protein A3D71_02495 [Candidatus Kaiserbacteria bacterium RIFCSPHIGHO2_02_FULL_55_20]